MKPVVSKEKFPKLFSEKPNRYQNPRRSLANSPCEHLIPMDYLIDHEATPY